MHIFLANCEHSTEIKRLLDHYLSTRNVDGCYNVGSMSIKAPYTTSHCRAHQVLVDVKFYQISRAAFQHLYIHKWAVWLRKEWFDKMAVENKILQKQIWSQKFGLTRLYLPDHLGRDGGLTNGRLSATHNPVDGSRFLVSAVVSADRQHLHVRILLLESVQSLLSPLRNTQRQCLQQQRYKNSVLHKRKAGLFVFQFHRTWHKT